jgi:hypothetical protein
VDLHKEVKDMGREIATLKAEMGSVDDILSRHEQYLDKIFSKLDKLSLKITLIVGVGVGLSYVLPYIFPKPKEPPPIIQIVPQQVPSAAPKGPM